MSDAPSPNKVAEPDAEEWQTRPEAARGVGQWLLRILAFRVGRPVARAITYAAALYFMLRRGAERAASRAYLQRILGRPPTPWETYRHFLCVSQITLDRLYLMAERFQRLRVRAIGLDLLDSALDEGRGVLLLSAHLGSFDALRVLSSLRPEVPIRVLLDLGQTAELSAHLNALNPAMAATVLDARLPGPVLVLEMQRALAGKAIVATLADRLRPGNPALTADFLGAPAQFPASPWLLGAALNVPVVLAFGLYRGGPDYEMHFERFALELPKNRRERQTALQGVVQRFSDRLAHYTRLAPYNWFNLYDFWALAENRAPRSDPAADERADPGRES
jgi:predicted LPLAT superfamily acyltransferase